MAAEPFHRRILAWATECFGIKDATDIQMRNQRFLEEAVELVQALGSDREEVMRVVDYVYSRPRGEPAQEVGGTLVGLACLCAANGLDMDLCGENEYRRIMGLIDKIRVRHNAKPNFSNTAEPPKLLDIEVQPESDLVEDEVLKRGCWTALRVGPHFNAVYICTSMDDGEINKGTRRLLEFLTTARIPA